MTSSQSAGTKRSGAEGQGPRRVEADPEAAAAEAEIADLGPLPEYIGYNLRRAQVASFRHLERTAGDIDLTPGQFSLLTFLGVNPGVSQKHLSQRFGLDTSTLSPVLERLSARGLIIRGRSRRDRRTYALRLSARGSRLLEAMSARVEAQEAVMTSVLAPGERARLIAMLRRIVRALDGDAGISGADGSGDTP